MKILNVIWGFSTGGIGKCYLTYNRLAEVDMSIQIDSVCIDVKNRNYDRQVLSENNITVVSIKNLFDISWLGILKQKIFENNHDVIFCHGFNGPIIMSLLKILYNVKLPMVCSYHGLYHAPTLSKKVLEPLYNNLQTFLYRHYAKKVILVEEYSKDYLNRKNVPQHKLVTVHNGIPDIGLKKNIEKKISDILYLTVASRLDKVKGIDYLIHSLSQLKTRTTQKFKLNIIGDGPELKNLQNLVDSLNLHDVVEFLGYQSNINEWLAKTDLFILPSLFECHSIALLEAMRAEKAIVATNVGGNTESVRDRIEGIIVEPQNSAALADAIMVYIANPMLITQYARNARKRYLELFTEERMMLNLIEVFKSIK